jgi:hypothetical protein
MTSADSVEDFFAAVTEGQTDVVRAMLDQEPALLAAMALSGVRAPLIALYNEHDALADELAARSAPLDVHESSAFDDNGRLRTVLRENPGAVRAWSLDGWQPLHLASFFGRTEAARQLLDEDAEVNSHSRNPSRATPLHCATAGRHSEVVWLLIGSGADVSARQEHGLTPLHTAAAKADAESVRALLAAGADPDAVDANGASARMLAPPEIAALLG